MKIAVLFDGGGLARLGLEEAGHDCIGFEIDPIKHYLSTFVGVGDCVNTDVREVDLTVFDGVWCSPPCQEISYARFGGKPISEFSQNMIPWCLQIKNTPLWIENVVSRDWKFGSIYNAAQFTDPPRQNRNRQFGGRYKSPNTLHLYKRIFPNCCPTVLASEYKGHISDKRRASRAFGRKLSLEECAYYQGFTIPIEWYTPKFRLSPSKWTNILYETIGNGVPPYMSKAFGVMYD